MTLSRNRGVPTTGVSAPGADHRPPAHGPSWFPSIEALRALAVTGVVISHFYVLRGVAAPAPWLWLGISQWGVTLFFLLSAFLLADTFWRPAPGQSLGQVVAAFYARRVWRIVPAYYAMVVVLFLFFADPRRTQSGAGLRQIASNLTLTQGLSPQTIGSLGLNGSLWTLTIEVLLYVTLPLLALLIGRFPVAATALLIIAGIGFRWWVAGGADLLRHFYFHSDMNSPTNQREFLLKQFPAILPSFTLGIWARWMVEFGPLRKLRDHGLRPLFGVVLLSLVPGLLALRLVLVAADPRSTLWYVALDILVGVLFVPALWLSVLGRPRASRSLLTTVLAWAGQRSYGVFLWHYPVILVVLGIGAAAGPARTDHAPVRALTAAGLSLFMGAVSWSLIERRSINAGRRMARRIVAGRSGRAPAPIWTLPPVEGNGSR